MLQEKQDFKIFPNCLLNGKIFGKKYLTRNVYFDFLYTIIRNSLFREEFSEILS